jgi:zinc protease
MSLLLRLAGLLSLLALPAVPAPQGDDLPASPADIEVPPLRDFVPPTPLRRTLGEGGAALLMIEDHELPLVEGLVVLEAGSLRDPSDKTGLAELAVEALREGGCDSFTGEQLNAWLDLRAAELAFEATDDHLRISFSCLSEDLDALLERVGALLTSPSFDERAVETARMQLLTAIARSADDSAALADKALDLML